MLREENHCQGPSILASGDVLAGKALSEQGIFMLGLLTPSR